MHSIKTEIIMIINNNNVWHVSLLALFTHTNTNQHFPYEFKPALSDISSFLNFHWNV